ncbi:MAG: LysR substrate-binding domain-containing protein [Halocynthiibacter sp.]
MNLKSLRVFVYIIEEGTLARASERLHLSQPAVSRLLKLLEEELGVALFDRYKKRLVATLAGDQFYAEAKRILASIDGIPNFLNQIDSGQTVPLRIVCHPRLTNGLVLPAMSLLARRLPDVRMHLEVHSRRDLGRYIAQELFDVGIASLPIPLDKIEPEEICEVELRVLLSADHDLAKRSHLSVRDLQPYRYIALNEHTLLRKITEGSLLRANERLEVFHEVSISAAAHHLVADGLGYTITDAVSVGSKMSKELRLIPLRPKIMMKFGVFRIGVPRRHDALDDFVACVREVAAHVAKL